MSFFCFMSYRPGRIQQMDLRACSCSLLIQRSIIVTFYASLTRGIVTVTIVSCYLALPSMIDVASALSPRCQTLNVQQDIDCNEFDNSDVSAMSI